MTIETRDNHNRNLRQSQQKLETITIETIEKITIETRAITIETKDNYNINQRK